MSSYHCPLVFCRGSNEWQAPSSCFLKAWTGFPGGASGMQETLRDSGSIPGSGRPLEEGTATHFSILAWRIPWTEEPGGLQSTVVAQSQT